MRVSGYTYCRGPDQRGRGNARTNTDAPREGGGDAMVDVLFWVFFGVGFIVMIATILSIFRTIWVGKKERDAWKGLEGKSSILNR